MMSEVLGHLGNDLGFGFLCKLASEIAESFRRRHDHKLVERAGQGNLIDPVRDRSSETFLFEFCQSVSPTALRISPTLE
jgi:hypothetical protein